MVEHKAPETSGIDWSIANLKDSALSDPWVQKRLREPLENGTVHCVFRPETSYPTRIYVFMNAGLWLQRNRRVSGCQDREPFITRQMNREERIYHHFDRRLQAYQYENWFRFFSAECIEADILERESAGAGERYISTLKTFEKIYAPFLNGVFTTKTNKPDLQLTLF